MFAISLGAPADLRSLSVFHYRTARRGAMVHAPAATRDQHGLPATLVRVLVARFSREFVLATPALRGVEPQEVVGVLGVSMPALNAPGRWRERAWPDLFPSPTDRRAHAHSVNRHLRTISRVIVDPRFRGVGIASALVRAYVASPLTVATEALAAMGHVSGFFTSAGMVRVWPELAEPASVVSRADARLRKRLGDLRGGLGPIRGVQAWELLDARGLLEEGGLSRADRCALIDALRAWARSSRATRALADGADEISLVHAAGRRLASRPAVFAFRPTAERRSS